MEELERKRKTDTKGKKWKLITTNNNYVSIIIINVNGLKLLSKDIV